MKEWWNKGIGIPFGNANFEKILCFYLFHCPCETVKNSKGTRIYKKVSKRAKTLRDQGWVKGQLRTLLSSMKHTSSGHLEYHLYNTGEKLEVKMNNLSQTVSLSDSHYEMVIMIKRTDMSNTSAIFYYLRNAFAHGSFSIVEDNKKNVYYFESSKDDSIKALIRLREETLLKWIDDFNSSPNVLREKMHYAGRQKRKKQKKNNKKTM